MSLPIHVNGTLETNHIIFDNLSLHTGP